MTSANVWTIEYLCVHSHNCWKKKKKKKKHAGNSFWSQPLGFEFPTCSYFHGLLLTNKLLFKSNSVAEMSSKWPACQKVCSYVITQPIRNGPLHWVSQGSATLGTCVQEWHAAAWFRTCWKETQMLSVFPHLTMRAQWFWCSRSSSNVLKMIGTKMTRPTTLDSACFGKTSVFVHEHRKLSFWRLWLNLRCTFKAVSFSSLTKASRGLWRSNSAGQFDWFGWISAKNVQAAPDLCQPSRTD